MAGEVKSESIDEFLARGGQIRKLKPSDVCTEDFRPKHVKYAERKKELNRQRYLKEKEGKEG